MGGRYLINYTKMIEGGAGGSVLKLFIPTSEVGGGTSTSVL